MMYCCSLCRCASLPSYRVPVGPMLTRAASSSASSSQLVRRAPQVGL